MVLRELWHRVTYPLRKARLDRELREEMELHLALRSEQLASAGLSPVEAAAAARRRFGNRSRLIAAAREAWGWRWLDGFGQDTRYIIRQLRRTPAFVLVVCVTIALGVAINATAFTFYDAVVLKPLGVADPSTVVRVVQDGRAFGFEMLPFTAYDILRRDAHTLRGATATTGPQKFVVVLPGHAVTDSRTATARFVTPNFARVLGVRADLGRWFGTSDDAAVVLDHAFWTNALDADPTVVGRTMRIGNALLTVIGIAPRTFAGTGIPGVAPDVWLPSTMVPTLMSADWRTDGRAHWQVLGRLAQAASLTALDAELRVVGRSVLDSAGKPVPLVSRKATFFQTDAGEFEVFQQVSIALLAALALMLGIAVVNLVNLFAARNAARESEITVRLALGANRPRIARQLASESVLLALLGGALGLLVSHVLASWIDRWMTSTIASISGAMAGASLDLAIDWRVAVYAVLFSLGIGLAVGLWPALRASRADMNAVLRQGAATAAGGAWTRRDVLLAVQIGSCVALLAAAGTLLGGMRASNTIDPRFDADHMLFVDVLEEDASPADITIRRADIQRRLAALPDVRAVAWTRRVPFGGTYLRRVTTPRGDMTVAIDAVSEWYFDAMGITLVRGRSFTRGEVERDAPVMLISDAAARRRWPSGDAIGRSVPPNDALSGPDTTKTYTIIGIVPDIRSQFLSRMNGPAAYFPYGLANRSGAFLVRTRAAPASAVNEVRAAIASVSPMLATRARVMTLRDGPMALQRLMAEIPAVIALVLALTGLALASVGIYGVISQIVTRRTREIGIRLALGASRRRVMWLVATKTLRPVAWGAAIGGVAALGLSLVLRSMIAAPEMPDLTFGAGAFNPPVLTGVLGVLAFVVAAALVVPLHRALIVDPARTLHAE